VIEDDYLFKMYVLMSCVNSTVYRRLRFPFYYRQKYLFNEALSHFLSALYTYSYKEYYALLFSIIKFQGVSGTSRIQLMLRSAEDCCYITSHRFFSVNYTSLHA